MNARHRRRLSVPALLVAWFSGCAHGSNDSRSDGAVDGSVGTGGGTTNTGGAIAGGGSGGTGASAIGGSGGTVVNSACPGDAANAYLGAPATIPGTVEAENFDPAGYSDYSAGNEGGAYRTDVDVDIKALGSGYVVGWMNAGEWLEYTVNVPVEGDYSIVLRAGAVDASRTLELSECGTSLTGPIAIPQIAAWGDMSTTTVGPVHLSAGLQVLRITVGSNDYVDFDSMTFEAVDGGSGGSGGTGGTVVTCDESAIGNAPNTLSVNVDSASNVIHKEIFGVLMERLGRDINGGLYVGTNSSIPNMNGMRNDIIDGFKEAGVGCIQWPGGCAANGYNWSPTDPSYDMGTDKFMQLCELVGAEPYITGRPNASDASSNLQWATYINNNSSHPEWNLKYFKVGNEVWGCGGNQNESTYEANYNANYDLLKNPINGNDLFLVAGTGMNDMNWIETMVKNIGSKIDGIEEHDYIYYPDLPGGIPCVGFSDSQYYDVVNRANRGQIAPRVEQIISILDKYDPDKRIKIMEDEWGDWLEAFDNNTDTWMQQVTVMDAISTAEQLHVFMAHADRIQMAGMAQAINVIHSLFLTRSSDGALVKTPAFYVWKMFVPHHTSNAKWAPNALASENITGNNTTFPVLSVGSTVDSAGHVNISLVNVDLVNTRQVHITLNSSHNSYSVSTAQVVTGTAKDSYNDFGQPERVNIQTLPSSDYEICGRALNVTLPSKSVVMLVLNPQ